MDMDLIIGIILILLAIYAFYGAVKGLITIFKTLKRNGNTIGIIFMILLTVGLPIIGLSIGLIYDAFIDDGSSLKEDDQELLNEEND